MPVAGGTWVARKIEWSGTIVHQVDGAMRCLLRGLWWHKGADSQLIRSRHWLVHAAHGVCGGWESKQDGMEGTVGHAAEAGSAPLPVVSRVSAPTAKATTPVVAGVQALGYPVRPMPQNCTRPSECSTQCSVGCSSGGKQDSARTWLSDAAATGRVTVLTRCAAVRIVTEEAPQGSAHGKAWQTAGVIATLVRMANMLCVYESQDRACRCTRLSARVVHSGRGLQCV
jgi:hypothetical protein